MFKLYERIMYCWQQKHRETCFTSFMLPGGVLRVSRCMSCRHLVDVTYNDESTLMIKLESKLTSIPGYPSRERFR